MRRASPPRAYAFANSHSRPSSGSNPRPHRSNGHPSFPPPPSQQIRRRSRSRDRFVPPPPPPPAYNQQRFSTQRDDGHNRSRRGDYHNNFSNSSAASTSSGFNGSIMPTSRDLERKMHELQRKLQDVERREKTLERRLESSSSSSSRHAHRSPPPSRHHYSNQHHHHQSSVPARKFPPSSSSSAKPTTFFNRRSPPPFLPKRHYPAHPPPPHKRKFGADRSVPDASADKNPSLEPEMRQKLGLPTEDDEKGDEVRVARVQRARRTSIYNQLVEAGILDGQPAELEDGVEGAGSVVEGENEKKWALHRYKNLAGWAEEED